MQLWSFFTLLKSLNSTSKIRIEEVPVQLHPSCSLIQALARYGYRGRDCRSNLYLLPTGEIVYFNASVVVLYNTEEQQQRHYLGHNDDVKWWENRQLSECLITWCQVSRVTWILPLDQRLCWKISSVCVILEVSAYGNVFKQRSDSWSLVIQLFNKTLTLLKHKCFMQFCCIWNYFVTTLLLFSKTWILIFHTRWVHQILPKPRWGQKRPVLQAVSLITLVFQLLAADSVYH